jgi:hypothetical protein
MITHMRTSDLCTAIMIYAQNLTPATFFSRNFWLGRLIELLAVKGIKMVAPQTPTPLWRVAIHLVLQPLLSHLTQDHPIFEVKKAS